MLKARKNHKRLTLDLSTPPLSSQTSSSNLAIAPTTSVISRSPSDLTVNNNDRYLQGPARILPNLYLGAYYNAQNSTQLMQHSITCVINVASEIAPSVPSSVEYHHLRWTHCQKNLAQSEFHLAIQLIQSAHLQNRNVLVHCQQGIERSAALIIAFLLYSSQQMKRLNDTKISFVGHNWSLDRAFNFVQKSAPAIRPNMELLYQLREYENTLTAAKSYAKCNIQTRTKRSESVTATCKPGQLKVKNEHRRTRSASFRDSLLIPMSLSSTAKPTLLTSAVNTKQYQNIRIEANPQFSTYNTLQHKITLLPDTVKANSKQHLAMSTVRQQQEEVDLSEGFLPASVLCHQQNNTSNATSQIINKSTAALSLVKKITPEVVNKLEPFATNKTKTDNNDDTSSQPFCHLTPLFSSVY